MRRKKSYSKMLLLLLVGVILLFFFLSSGVERLTAIIVNESGDVLSTQSARTPYSTLAYQSFFSPDVLGIIEMQASKSIGDEEKKYVVFSASALNPFDKETTLESVTVYKNGQKVEEKLFDKTILQEGDKYAFRTEPIYMDAPETQPSIINIDFVFEANAVKKKVEFKYNYVYLHVCHKDSDCNAVASKCDRGNIARFSTDETIMYCTKVCGATADCFTGQVCRSGICGI